MSDPLEIVVELDPTNIISSLNCFSPRLPIEIRRRFVQAFLDLTIQHSDEQVQQMLHGKTVGEILEECEQASKPHPIASGETDGKKWALYAPPVNPTD